MGGGRRGPTGGIKTNAGEYEYDERDGKKNGQRGWRVRHRGVVKTKRMTIKDTKDQDT